MDSLPPHLKGALAGARAAGLTQTDSVLDLLDMKQLRAGGSGIGVLRELLIKYRLQIQVLALIVAEMFGADRIAGSVTLLEEELKIKIPRGKQCGLLRNLKQDPSSSRTSGRRVRSLMYVILLDGSMLFRCMTDSNPTSRGGCKTLDEWSDILYAAKTLAWAPELHPICPGWSKRRLRFIALVGYKLTSIYKLASIKDLWCSHVMCFLPVHEEVALVKPQRKFSLFCARRPPQDGSRCACLMTYFR
mmetsp:Transcript_140053/g.435583  ORF Transcript_140053/g.435583 Transcript_140053/m.435583 type:complete len:246 (+) Transcript_140053:72-809(+)